jgi:hypothetical protein
MIVRVIYATVLICLSANLIATQGLYQCLFLLCQNRNDKINKNVPLCLRVQQ